MILDSENQKYIETRVNAMLQELASQRNAAMDRCVNLQAEIASLKEKLAEHEKNGLTKETP